MVETARATFSRHWQRREPIMILEGRKTLVWTNFVRNILTLERMLARYRPAIIHGGIPSDMVQPNAQRTRGTATYCFADLVSARRRRGTFRRKVDEPWP